MFKGIIVPMVTPFCRDEKQSINYDATKSMIDYLLSKGVSGLFILGSNGEFAAISNAEKKEFMKFVIEYVNHRIPVLVGTGTCNYYETLELSLFAKECGADGISLVPPFFIKPSDEEIFDYFHKLSEKVELPILLYNIPKNTGYSLDPKLVDRLFTIRHIIGVKDSSGNDETILSYLESAKKHDKLFLVGSDSKISMAYAHGACGAIAGTANLICEHLVKLWTALEHNDEVAAELQKDIDVLRNCMKLNTVPSVLKRAVELQNIANVGCARFPVNCLENKFDAEIKEMLKHYFGE